MIFSTNITTVANTPKNIPLCTILKCTAGLVYHVTISFPPGPSGLSGLRVLNQDVSIYPKNRGDWFVGDNMQLDFDDMFEVTKINNVFNIETYNEDEAYEHSIQFSIGVVSRDEFIDRFLPGRETAKLTEAVERLTEQLQISEYKSSKSVIASLLGRGG